MNAIVAFITARLAEDEARARAAIASVADDHDGDPGEWTAGKTIEGSPGAYVESAGGSVVSDEGYPSYEQAVHIAAEAPNATLRRCVMVRAMLQRIAAADKYERETLQRHGGFDDNDFAEHPTIVHYAHRDIAAYWNQHAEYRQEWATDVR